MALTRIPLPSFSLVLTSGPQPLHGYPRVIRLETSSSPAMCPTARDYLMQTIDTRGEPDDSIQDSLNSSATCIDYGRIHLQTIIEEEEPSTLPVVDKKQETRTTKQYVLILLQSLRRKLFSPRGTAPVQLTNN